MRGLRANASIAIARDANGDNRPGLARIYFRSFLIGFPLSVFIVGGLESSLSALRLDDGIDGCDRINYEEGQTDDQSCAEYAAILIAHRV